MRALNVTIVSFLFVIFSFGISTPVLAAEPPYLKMDGPDSRRDISRPSLITDLVASNPLYVFTNPFTQQAMLTQAKIQEIHSHLPQTKVILHLLCCTIFDSKEVDSSVAKVHADLQNTQAEFDAAWTDHRDAYMKNATGGYVYFIVPETGNYWVRPGDAYLMDPAHPYYQDFLYNKIREHVTSGGYDGAYLDLMYPTFMQQFYTTPKPVVGGTPITRDQWNSKLISLSRYLQNRRVNDPDPKMKNALIITNSVGGGPGDSNDPVDRIQFNRDLQTQGVQIENPFGNYRSMSTADWLGIVNRIRDITALRNNQMKGWLNYHAGDITYTNEQECNNHGLFAYSSYLLGNQSPYFAFNFECLMGPGIRKEPTQNLTHIRLGNPLSSYQQTSSLYLREYENGMVLVNPTSGQRTYQATVSLKNAYAETIYPTNSTITVPAHSGMVLLKTSPTRNPADLTDKDDEPGDQVNEADYNLLLSDFGKTGSPGWIRADINRDARVDVFDYNLLVGAFGT